MQLSAEPILILSKTEYQTFEPTSMTYFTSQWYRVKAARLFQHCLNSGALLHHQLDYISLISKSILYLTNKIITMRRIRN